MDFQLSDIHTDLAATVDAMLGKADMPAAARAWAAGDRTAVAKVYSQLADAGTLPAPVDDDHEIGVFVDGFYAPHRFAL